jgi:hypothetical protein
MRTLPLSRCALLLAVVLAGGVPAAAQDLWVYDNALAGGFEDWSWATRNLAATGDVHSPPNAISWEPDNWQGVYFTAMPASTAPTTSPCVCG